MKDLRALFQRPHRAGLILTSLTLLTTISALNATRAQEPQEEPGEPMPAATAPATRVSPLTPAALAQRDGRHAEAARLLKEIDPLTLDARDAERWRSLAARAALRTDDFDWLQEINSHPTLADTANELLVLNAMRFLLAAKFSEARQLLLQIKNPDTLGEISRRRYLQLWARLEQVAGNTQAERGYLVQLVNRVGLWGTAACQSCHANPRQYGDAVTTLNITDWWVGRRFSELLKGSPEANRVRAEAMKSLASDPNNQSARLRLAYALRALGQPSEAEQELRKLPWAEFPDREVKKPLRFGMFP